MPHDNRQRRALEEFMVNDHIKFYVNQYNNPELTGDKIKVTFIENEFAEELLELSPVGYENEQGKIKMKPAYKEDLSRDTMPKEEKRKWEYRFDKMRNKLESELKKAKRRKWQINIITSKLFKMEGQKWVKPKECQKSKNKKDKIN